jgi:hypothetical protein
LPSWVVNRNIYYFMIKTGQRLFDFIGNCCPFFKFVDRMD